MDILAEMLLIANEQAAPILAALRADQDEALDVLCTMLADAHLAHDEVNLTNWTRSTHTL